MVLLYQHFYPLPDGINTTVFLVKVTKQIKVKRQTSEMKTIGLLALGGATNGLKFEDLSFDTLKSAFNQVIYRSLHDLDGIELLYLGCAKSLR